MFMLPFMVNKDVYIMNLSDLERPAGRIIVNLARDTLATLVRYMYSSY